VTALLLASPRLVVFWPARLRALLVDGRAWIVRAAALATAIFPALVDLGPKSLGCRPAAA